MSLRASSSQYRFPAPTELFSCSLPSRLFERARISLSPAACQHLCSCALLLILALIGCCLSSCSVRIPLPAEEAALAQKSYPCPDPRVDPVHTPLPAPLVPANLSPEGNVTIWVLANNLHTSIVAPYDWLLASGYRPPHGLTVPPTRYRNVNMSWGNRTAYLNKRWLFPWEVFAALFTPSPSVMEIIPVSYKIELVCSQPRMFRREVPRRFGPRLAAFLNGCARHDEDGSARVVAASSWGDGKLVDCRIAYYLPRICNVWTAQALEACGVDMHINRSFTADGVIEQCLNQGFTVVDKPPFRPQPSLSPTR